MKKFLATLCSCFVLLQPVFAVAATYHIGPGGADGNAGTTYGSRWETIGRANTAARPGDIIYVYENYPNTYSHFPNPDSGGSNPTGEGFITYIGASLNGDPMTNLTIRDRVRIPQVETASKYTVIKGMHSTGGYYPAHTARFDSVRAMIFDGTFGNGNADYLYVGESEFLGTGGVNIGHTAGTYTAGITINGCRFPNLGRSVTGDNIWQHGLSSPGMVGGGVPTARVESLTVTRNYVNMEILPGNEATGLKFFNTRHATFAYNRWEINNRYAVSGKNSVFYVRDSSSNILFNKDTLLTIGVNNIVRMWDGGNSYQTCFNLSWDSCYYHIAGSGADIYGGNETKSISLTYNVFAVGGTYGHGMMFSAPIVSGTNVIDHNTFVAPGQIGILSFAHSGTWAAGPVNRMTVTNNIIAQNSNVRIHGVCAESSEDRNASTWGLFSSLDGLTAWDKKLTSNNNLYWVKSQVGSTPGNRAHGYYSGETMCSRTGAGSAWDGLSNVIGGDSLSKFGNPLFDKGGPDTLVIPTFNNAFLFDPQLHDSSIARGMGTGGTDVGAVAFTAYPKIDVAQSLVQLTGLSGGPITATFNVCNIGTNELIISGVTVTNPNIAASASGGFPVALDPGLCAIITLTYTIPGSPESGVAVASVASNDPGRPNAIVTVNVNVAGTIPLEGGSYDADP